MNAQVRLQDIEISFKCSLSAAYTILDGLAKLPIERAGTLYSSLQEVVDKAVHQVNAPRAPASPAPVESTLLTDEGVAVETAGEDSEPQAEPTGNAPANTKENTNPQATAA